MVNATIDTGDYDASVLVTVYSNLLDLHSAFCRAEATDVANTLMDSQRS